MVEEKCDIYGCSDKIVAGSDVKKNKKKTCILGFGRKMIFRPLDKKMTDLGEIFALR